MDLNKLFLLARPVTEDLIGVNKYTFWAVKAKVSNYRIATLNTVLEYQKKVGEELPPYLFRFINDAGQVLLIANVINRQVTQLVVRSLKDKKFHTVVLKQQYPYGLGTINLDKTFSEPIVVCEGTMDRDYLRSLYPNVVACLTSSLTKIQLELICKLTNTVILAYDNDETGNKSYWKDKKTLEERGVFVKRLKHPEGLKDPGDVVQKLYEGDDYLFNFYTMYYRMELSKLCEVI